MNSFLRFIVFWRHVIPALVRVEMGRWHVFRDTPRWVLEELEACGEYCTAAERAVEPDLESFYAAARQELWLRERRERLERERSER